MGLSEKALSTIVSKNAAPNCENPKIADAVPLLSDSEKGFNAKLVVSGNNAPRKNIAANNAAAEKNRLFRQYAKAKNPPAQIIVNANAIFR